MGLEMTREQLDDVVAHARGEAPRECCGIIGGTGDRTLATYRTRNIDESQVHYTIHPEDQYQAMRDIEDVHGWDMIGFYHSHPMSEAFPSPTDVRHAVDSGYSEVSRFLIVSLADPDAPVARSFWLTGGQIAEEPVEIVSDDGAS